MNLKKCLEEIEVVETSIFSNKRKPQMKKVSEDVFDRVFRKFFKIFSGKKEKSSSSQEYWGGTTYVILDDDGCETEYRLEESYSLCECGCRQKTYTTNILKVKYYNEKYREQCLFVKTDYPGSCEEYYMRKFSYSVHPAIAENLLEIFESVG